MTLKQEKCEEFEEETQLACDGLENLAGYICHRLKEVIPNIHDNWESSYTWVNHLSEGGLSKPTAEMMTHMSALENIFNEANGTEIDIRENYLKHLNTLAAKVDWDEKIKTIFFRSRMFFRLRTLNRDLIDTAKLKKRKMTNTIT
jgi:hypothetical protein